MVSSWFYNATLAIQWPEARKPFCSYYGYPIFSLLVLRIKTHLLKCILQACLLVSFVITAWKVSNLASTLKIHFHSLSLNFFYFSNEQVNRPCLLKIAGVLKIAHLKTFRCALGVLKITRLQKFRRAILRLCILVE